MVFARNRILEIPPSRGRHGVFIKLWTAGFRRIRAYVYTMVFNWADAEDLCQEVGVAAWESFDEFDESQDFVAWVCGIARNKVLMFNRKARRRIVATDALLNELDRRMKARSRALGTQVDALQVCLSQLKDHERTLVKSYYFQESSMQEISERTGRSLQALYKSLQRIHARLFECMRRRSGDGSEQ